MVSTVSTGVRDKVRCFNCGRSCENWAVNDDPWFVHIKIGPVCKFIRQIDGKTFTDKVKPLLSNRFESVEARIETFKDWPSSANHSSLEEYAEAGFYYTGMTPIICQICSSKYMRLKNYCLERCGGFGTMSLLWRT